ncbi:MAG: O-antigen ligase family protein [Chthonomonadales bacterium]|nr:O-antigen ligase family protein [Chthonomonadales bacterium]
MPHAPRPANAAVGTAASGPPGVSVRIRMSACLQSVGWALGLLIALLVLRAYLLPNTWPVWFDQWRNVNVHYLGLGGARGVGAAAVALATVVFGSYYPIASRRDSSFGLWLITGAWLSLTTVVILAPWSPDAIVLRESGLLLGYVGGLAAARLLPRIETYIASLVGLGALQSTLAIAYRVQGLDTFVSGTVIRSGGSFGSPTELSVVAVFIVPLAVCGVLGSSSTVERTYFMFASACLLAALILTWERSAVVACLVAVLLLVRKTVPARLQFAILAAALCLLFVVFYVRSSGPINADSSARSVQGRVETMQASALAFRHHWFDGVGVGRLSLPVQIEIAGRPARVSLIDPHNQILFWAAEMGIVGAVLAVALAWFVYRTLRDAGSPWRDGVAAVWVSVLIAGMFNTLFGLSGFGCGNMLIGSLLGLTIRLGALGHETSKAIAAIP